MCALTCADGWRGCGVGSQWNHNVSTSPSDYYTAKNATFDANQTYYTAPNASAYYTPDSSSDSDVVYYTPKNTTAYDMNQTYYAASQSYYSAGSDSDATVVYYTPVNATAYDTNQTYYEGASSFSARVRWFSPEAAGGRRTTHGVRRLQCRWRA